VESKNVGWNCRATVQGCLKGSIVVPEGCQGAGGVNDKNGGGLAAF